ncbi:MAG: GtrA family protein selenocysteine-containing [Pseudomonadota bacterium]|jgi:glycosyltransferase involved in cell wall biosynthesis
MPTDYYPTILIPAYQPNENLVKLIKALRQARAKQRIIVVDDGSDADKQIIFSKIQHLNVELLQHTKNKGKGQALKTGFQYWLATSHPRDLGLVTADADGQHLPQDILHLCDAFMQKPSDLYLGKRTFNKVPIPWRSRIGNKLTKYILRLFSKTDLEDTQTGLRAIPRKLLPALLSSNATGYEFELEMILIAEENQVLIQEIPIKTVYIDHNNSSHFNPLIDSIKIYFVFIRFAAISLISAVIDFALFFLTYWLKKNIFLAVLLGRILSATFNFKLNQHLAFKSKSRWLPAAIKYTVLASFLGLIAYSLIKLIHSFGINVYSSKIIAEIALFILSFTIQRFFIFNKAPALEIKS